MHTQVSHAELVTRILADIQKHFNIEIQQFSLAAMQQEEYASGTWLYEIDNHMTVHVYRWPHRSKSIGVEGFGLDERPDEFEARLKREVMSAVLQLMTEDEMSKERQLLERIANGEMAFGPSEKTDAALRVFQKDAEDIMESLQWLVEEDLIGGYQPHPISYAGDGTWIDLILITGGLTFKGQDKSQWPD